MEYKTKFSCFCQEDLRESGDVLPSIVNLTLEGKEWSALGSGHFSSGKEHFVNQRIRGWVVTRFRLEARNIFILLVLGNEQLFLCRPVHAVVTVETVLSGLIRICQSRRSNEGTCAPRRSNLISSTCLIWNFTQRDLVICLESWRVFFC